MLRGAQLWIAGALGLAALAAAVVWCTEPGRRREILFETPLRVVPGAHAEGAFHPEHDGSFHISLRFPLPTLPAAEDTEARRKAFFAELDQALGVGGLEAAGPAGFTASFVVREQDRPVAQGTTGERLYSGGGGGETRVSISSVEKGRELPHTFELRIERAVEALAAYEARLVVAAAGDWIHYAWLERIVRIVLLVMLLGAGAAIAAIVWYVRLRRRRRRSAST